MRSIRLLIDGYNLLFQSELVGSGRGLGWLDRARTRLLKQLCQCLTEDQRSTTTVVFDASQSGPDAADSLFDGIEVRFARDHAEADDLLEELIRRSPQPKLLQVVSSDRRLRRSTRARRAESIDAETFLRHLEAAVQDRRRPADPPTMEQSDEPELSSSEIEYWLKQFGHPPPAD